MKRELGYQNGARRHLLLFIATVLILLATGLPLVEVAASPSIPVTLVHLSNPDDLVKYLAEGEIWLMGLMVEPRDATNQLLHISSANPAVARVDTPETDLDSLWVVQITALTPGKTSLFVTADDSSYSQTLEITVFVEPVEQIKVIPASSQLFMGSRILVEAYGTSMHPSAPFLILRNVTWSSSHPEIATVELDPNGVTYSIVGHFPGKAIISATHSNGARGSCDIEVVIGPSHVPVQNVFVSGTHVRNEGSDYYIEMVEEDIGQIEVFIWPDNATIKQFTISSSNEKVMVVDNDGKIVAGSQTGKYEKIIHITPLDPAYQGRPVTLDVSLYPHDYFTFVIEPEKLSLELGDYYSLYAKYIDKNLVDWSIPVYNVTWISSDTSVVTVDAQGRVFAAGTGEATITALTKPGAKASCDITVIRGANYIEVDALSVETTHSIYDEQADTWIMTLPLGEIGEISVYPQPDNATIKLVDFSSDNPAVATVSQFPEEGTNPVGYVYPHNIGKTYIRAKSLDPYAHQELVIIVEVVSLDTMFMAILPPAPYLPGDIITLNEKTSIYLSAVMAEDANYENPVYLTNVTWSSSDTLVATVDQNGMVYGARPGEVTITALAGDGIHSATCQI
ncbi:MAG: Ig-like domain-containing protein, partial [Symbiobacteriaceae bacterium]|nr:Ig-like domain-containing protein [Symbiobacteriaceae bacterium]